MEASTGRIQRTWQAIPVVLKSGLRARHGYSSQGSGVSDPQPVVKIRRSAAWPTGDPRQSAGAPGWTGITLNLFMHNHDWKTEVLLPGSWRGATCALLSNGRHHIIVDTGMPHEAPRLIEALAAHNLTPSNITAIINTHFHVDHVLNNCIFSAAHIYASQQSYDWCCAAYEDLLNEQNWETLALKYYPEMSDYERTQELMGALRRFALRWWDRQRLGDPSRFRWIETQPLPDGLEFLVTQGHVPGHTSVIVHNADQSIVIAGDALLTREHDENVFTMIPHNRRQSHADRAHILAMAGRILPGHDDEFLREAHCEEPTAHS